METGALWGSPQGHSLSSRGPGGWEVPAESPSHNLRMAVRNIITVGAALTVHGENSSEKLHEP